MCTFTKTKVHQLCKQNVAPLKINKIKYLGKSILFSTVGCCTCIKQCIKHIYGQGGAKNLENFKKKKKY